MTTLVLHAGAEYADGGAVHEQLSAWREELAAAGVVLPPGRSPHEWRETGHGLLQSGAAPAATAAAGTWLREATEAGARAALLSSDALSDALTSPEQAATLSRLATSFGVDVRVVVVVREQVGYINSLYCKRVLALESARSFAEFATTSVPAHRFDYVASFGAVADTDGVDLVAVPYPDLLSVGAGTAVLRAAGLDGTGLPAETAAPAPVPGPVLVGAARLLHKRLRRLSMFHEHGKARLRILVDRLAQRAAAASWESTTFWGWDVALRRAVEAEYGASNEMFAEFVWGTPWQEPFSTGKPQRVDLADLEPAVLHDVLTSVDTLVEGLAKGTLDLG
ncbi:MAG: hypothetical protein ACR2JU_08605 [Nocardioidaceae bacterium]